mmetsp:Transcript_29706/g.35329  ORF Transcript_29706/g.35329 Transcript_29706/m.35329 type:complete len:102 (-) Transcript_29706:1997-2302(-)
MVESSFARKQRFFSPVAAAGFFLILGNQGPAPPNRDVLGQSFVLLNVFLQILIVDSIWIKRPIKIVLLLNWLNFIVDGSQIFYKFIASLTRNACLVEESQE